MKKLLTFILLLPNIVLAQAAPPPTPATPSGGMIDNLNTATAGVYSQNVGLMGVIGQIVKVLLGLLGTVFVILILIGGFKWMTAMGDSKKVEDAKNLISNSVVGIVIILAAYAIAAFVLKEVYKATTVVPTP